MPDALPDRVASLSKYIDAHEHYKLLQYITRDTPSEEVREEFGDDLYVTAKARYLTVEDGVVLRDGLIHLVQDERGFTERVKMTMYFLFMFRDSRYRAFICRIVGKDNGKWNSSVLAEKHGSFFKNAGGTKAFTNLRQFLVQIGIIENRTWVVHMPDPSTWFATAAEIAAYSITDSIERRRFVSNPERFLIKNGINALLNATPAELANLDLGEILGQDENYLPNIEIADKQSRIERAELKKWDRTAPGARDREVALISSDPIALERAETEHFRLEERIVKLSRINQLVPRNSKYIDLTVEGVDTSILFEMKSCLPGTVRAQLRRAVSQLLEYRYLYRDTLKEKVILCAVLERKPKGKLSWMVSYLESLGVALVWKNENSGSLSCTEYTTRQMASIFPQVKKKEF